MMNRGVGPASPDSTVTQDTAQMAPASNPAPTVPTTQNSGRNNGNPVRNRDTATQANTVSNPGTSNQPPATPALPDSATVAGEIRGMVAATDPDSAASPTRLRAIVSRASDIYDESRFPDGIRQQAAEAAAFAFIEMEDNTSACRWLGLAARLLPPSQQDKYDRTRTSLGCQ